MIIMSQVAILLGVIDYTAYHKEKPTLGIIHISLFYSIWLIVELLYRYWRSRDKKFVKPVDIMTADEFE